MSVQKHFYRAHYKSKIKAKKDTLRTFHPKVGKR